MHYLLKKSNPKQHELKTAIAELDVALNQQAEKLDKVRADLDELEQRKAAGEDITARIIADHHGLINRVRGQINTLGSDRAALRERLAG